MRHLTGDGLPFPSRFRNLSGAILPQGVGRDGLFPSLRRESRRHRFHFRSCGPPGALDTRGCRRHIRACIIHCAPVSLRSCWAVVKAGRGISGRQVPRLFRQSLHAPLKPVSLAGLDSKAVADRCFCAQVGLIVLRGVASTAEGWSKLREAVVAQPATAACAQRLSDAVAGGSLPLDANTVRS